MAQQAQKGKYKQAEVLRAESLDHKHWELKGSQNKHSNTDQGWEKKGGSRCSTAEETPSTLCSKWNKVWSLV